jgi:hypothetical protein
MAEWILSLEREDQSEVLEQVRAKTGRPIYLLEKDVWVVWALGTLFESPLAADLTFKGGTSLSKGKPKRHSEEHVHTETGKERQDVHVSSSRLAGAGRLDVRVRARLAC